MHLRVRGCEDAAAESAAGSLYSSASRAVLREGEGLTLGPSNICQTFEEGILWFHFFFCFLNATITSGLAIGSDQIRIRGLD